MKVGFIGLGAMGSGVCMNIINNGYEVMVYDLNRATLERFNKIAFLANSAEEVFNYSDVTLLSLPSSIQVEEITNKFLEIGVEGKSVIDISTSYPLSSRTIYKKFKSAGGEFADASLTGTPQQAKDGGLIVTFGGDEETFEKYSALVHTFAKSYKYIGASGAGNIAKLANNYLAIMYIALYAEIFPLVEKLDIDVNNLFNIIGESGVGCRMYQSAGKKIVEKKYNQSFALELAFKDVLYVKKIFQDYQSPSFLLDGGLNALQIAQNKGLGKNDISEIAKVQREFLNLD